MSNHWIVAEKIEKMPGGYVVNVRWPFGPDVIGCGPVLCSTWQEVIDLLAKSARDSNGEL